MTTFARAFPRFTKQSLVLLALAVGLAGCSKTPTGPDVTLTIVDITVGTGATVVAGSLVSMEYTAWIYDASQPGNKGTQIETTGAVPVQFYVGVGQVIGGWDLGLPGMKVGGVRELTVPPELGFGAVGSTNVPPNTTLVFDMTLVTVQ